MDGVRLDSPVCACVGGGAGRLNERKKKIPSAAGLRFDEPARPVHRQRWQLFGLVSMRFFRENLTVNHTERTRPLCSLRIVNTREPASSCPHCTVNTHFFFFYTDPPGRFEPDVLRALEPSTFGSLKRRTERRAENYSRFEMRVTLIKSRFLLYTASVSTANTTTELSGANGANVPDRQFVRAPIFEDDTKQFCCNFPIIRTIQRKVIGSSYAMWGSLSFLTRR